MPDEGPMQPARAQWMGILTFDPPEMNLWRQPPRLSSGPEVSGRSLDSRVKEGRTPAGEKTPCFSLPPADSTATQVLVPSKGCGTLASMLGVAETENALAKGKGDRSPWPFGEPI
jgi:hypothetical protein